MRVFVAGATGAIGRPLVKELIARGHEVVGLARSPENERLLAGSGATPVRADLFDAASLAKAASGCDAIVRAATRIPATGRGSAAWRENDRIRREGTRALLQAARDAGVPRFVQESIVWVARPPDGSRFDESSPARPDDITRSAAEAERQAAGHLTLRLGWLYGPDTTHTRAFATMIRKRRLPIVGRADAPLSWLHVDDAARAFALAVETRATGVLHVVDDEPAPFARFAEGLARIAGAKPPMRVPTWLGALGAGRHVADFLTTPMVTTNAKAKRALGWTPRFATLEEGLDDVARAWRAEGFTP